MKAVIFPTCRSPLSIRWALTHIMSTTRQFIINIMPGIIKVITRLVNSCVFFKFSLAISKRSSSVFSLTKALITESPVKISLETRFRLSTSVCMSLNLGIAIETSRSTNPIITSTAIAIIHPMPAPVCATL